MAMATEDLVVSNKKRRGTRIALIEEHPCIALLLRSQEQADFMECGVAQHEKCSRCLEQAKFINSGFAQKKRYKYCNHTGTSIHRKCSRKEEHAQQANLINSGVAQEEKC